MNSERKILWIEKVTNFLTKWHLILVYPFRDKSDVPILGINEWSNDCNDEWLAEFADRLG